MTPAPHVETILQELVAFDTQNPTGQELPLAEKLARDLTTLGAHKVEIIAAHGHTSTFAIFGPGHPQTLINAHIDTVPANSGYTRNAWQLFRQGDQLHGLGTADTKGAIAAVLAALHERASEQRLPNSVAVLFSGDEERGGQCIREFLASDRIRGLKRAIVCEPTGCRVGTRHRGIVAFRLTARSKGGHSSLVAEVPNPLACLVRVGADLITLGERHQKLGPPGLQGLCMNIASLEGGVAFNVIPSQASLVFSLRPPPRVDRPALLQEARLACEKAALPLTLAWENVAENPAFATQDPAGFRTLLGPRLDQPVDLPYGTEAGQFVEAGIDAVVIGPGRVEQAHAPDEYVHLDELKEAVRIFDRVLG